MKTVQMTLDQAQAAPEKATIAGDTTVRAMGWFIAPSLMDEQHRQEWERSMKAGIERFYTRFDRLPVKVILHTVPIPEKWDADFPGIEFRPTKSILPGHFVLCNDAGEFFGTTETSSLDAR